MLWLFAIDTTGLTVADCQGITRFRQRGGGIMATRDHQDLGISLKCRRAMTTNETHGRSKISRGTSATRLFGWREVSLRGL